MEKTMIQAHFFKIIKIHHSLSIASALFGYITVLKRPFTVLYVEIYQILSRLCVSCHLGAGATMLPIWSECQASVLVVMMVEMLVYTERSSNHLGNNLSKEFWEPRSPTPSRQGRRRRRSVCGLRLSCKRVFWIPCPAWTKQRLFSGKFIYLSCISFSKEILTSLLSGGLLQLRILVFDAFFTALFESSMWLIIKLNILY